MTEKIERTHLKIFGADADETEIAQFGSTADKPTRYTKNLNTIQSLPAYSHGWQKAIEGGAAPVLEEVNGLQYLISASVAYLYQQGGFTQAWHQDTTYYNGSCVSKIASPTNSLLGSDASKVTLVYRSVQNNNQGNALPSDFLSNEHWAFVDVIQPQGSNLLDFSGSIGEIRMHSDVTNTPKNWHICDGTSVDIPSGRMTVPDYRDAFPYFSSTPQHNKQGSGFTTSSTPNHYHSAGTLKTNSFKIGWNNIEYQMNIVARYNDSGNTQRWGFSVYNGNAYGDPQSNRNGTFNLGKNNADTIWVGLNGNTAWAGNHTHTIDPIRAHIIPITRVF